MTLICIHCGSSLVRRGKPPNYERNCFKCGQRWFPEAERQQKQQEKPASTQMEFGAVKTKWDIEPTLLRNAPAPEVRFALAHARLRQADEERMDWLNEQCGLQKREREERAAVRAGPPSGATRK